MAIGGTWTAGYEHFTAGADARLAMNYQARRVRLVLAGDGPVTGTSDGKPLKTIRGSGTPTLYTLVDDDSSHRARLDIRPAPGIEGCFFTFG
ncbi:hypothetical protein DEJ46_00835 [Streptomyces venezuelae]|uniref:DipZ thioredoxin-like C-terminal domain-containing protein n=2 Tax=Streptomyces TaxID=1883 RepID=A0A5P2AND1_STRVZ|nr:hypothetical protein DEJ46_00835 [Streptomyces venezuelae]